MEIGTHINMSTASKESQDDNGSRNEVKIDIDANTIAIDLEATKSAREENSNVHSERKMGVSNIEKKMPPYVIWVQFLGIRNNEEAPATLKSLEEPDERTNYVKKVFIIVMFMLIMTAILCSIIHLVDPVRVVFLKYSLFFMIAGCIILIGLSYALQCSVCTRQAPCSYICLGLAVLGDTILCVTISLKTKTYLIYFVLAGLGIVVMICILLAYSRFDFTRFLLYIVLIGAVLTALMLMILIAKLVFDFYIKPLHIAILVIVTLFSVVTLVMELQMILGGRTVELDLDEYAVGAFMIYTSIVDIFIKMLILANLIDS